MGPCGRLATRKSRFSRAARQHRHIFNASAVLLLLVFSRHSENRVFANNRGGGGTSMTQTARPSASLLHGTRGSFQSSLPRLASSSSGARADAEKARQLISHEEGSINPEHLKLASDEVKYNGSVTVGIGPSRAGKSHLMNLLLGRPAFGVSKHPKDPMTFGAWYAEADTGDLLVDTEGQSHNVSGATIRLLSVVYPIAQNLIWSDKAVGDDKFFEMLEDLAKKMRDFKNADTARKPRLVYVVRDNSFEFEGYTNFDEYVQEEIAPQIMELGLFSSVRGVALRSLIDYKSGTAEADQEISDLRTVLQEEHPGPLMPVHDKSRMQNLVKVVNEQGVYSNVEMVKLFVEQLGAFQDAQSNDIAARDQLAEKFGWEPKKMIDGFHEAMETVQDHFTKFNMKQGSEWLSNFTAHVENFARDMQHKEEVNEMVEELRVREVDRSASADVGGHVVEGGVWGGTAGAFGAALFAATNPVIAVASAAAGTAGAVMGDGKRKTATVKFKSSEVYTANVSKFKGWRMPSRQRQAPFANATRTR